MASLVPLASDGLELYRILSLTHTRVELSEVKRQYRRLSLLHHPDRGGDAEVFKRLGYAHSILSDPQKRRIYDSYGSPGLRLFDSFCVHRGDDEADVLQEQQPLDRMLCVLCVVGGVLAVCACSYCALLAARIGGRSRVPWLAVLAPVWLVDAAMLAHAFKPDASAPEDGQEPGACAARATARVWAGALAVSHVALGLKLDGLGAQLGEAVPWCAVLAPHGLSEALAFVSAARSLAAACAVARAPPKLSTADSASSTASSAPGAGLAGAHSAVGHLACLLSLVACALKGDSVLALSWFAVLAPAWAGCAVQLAVVGALFARGQPVTADDAGALDVRVRLARSVGTCALLLLVTIALRVHSALLVFAPLFVLSAVFVCCCGCWVAAFCSANSPRDRPVPGPYGPESHASIQVDAHGEGQAAQTLPMPRETGGMDDSLLVSV